MTDTVDEAAEFIKQNGIFLPEKCTHYEDGTLERTPHTAASMWLAFRHQVEEHHCFVDAVRTLVAEYGGPKQWRAFIALRDVLAQVDGE